MSSILLALLLLPGTDNFNGLKAMSVVSCAIKYNSEILSKVQVQKGASIIQVRMWVSASHKSGPD